MALCWNMGLWVRTVQADLLGRLLTETAHLDQPLPGCLTTEAPIKAVNAAAAWLGAIRRDQKGRRGDDQPQNRCVGFHLGWGVPCHQEGPWIRLWAEQDELARDKPQRTPVPLKPETVSHVAEQFSWAPYPAAFHLGAPFISTGVSSGSSFLSARQEPTLALEGLLLPASESWLLTNCFTWALHSEATAQPLDWWELDDWTIMLSKQCLAHSKCLVYISYSYNNYYNNIM